MRRLIVVVLLLAACSPTEPSADLDSTATTTSTSLAQSTTTTSPPPFSVSSPAFDNGGPIPVDHTCDGIDVSPELDIVGIPQGAESLVVIVDDPDAAVGVWDHWVEFDIVPPDGSLLIDRATGPIGVAGVNSWNLPGYMGPCPPIGEEHEYHFEVYALDQLLDLPEGVPSTQVYAAMDGSTISSVELVGTYARQEG